LSWHAPMLNADGSRIADLSGFRIHYGPSPTALPQTLEVKDPRLLILVVPNLGSGTWFFAVSSVNAQGEESALSSPVTLTINR